MLYFRIQSLEASCEEKEKQLNEERGKFSKLKEDFKYNLKLLEERDAELDRYDASFAGMSLDCNERRFPYNFRMHKQSVNSKCSTWLSDISYIKFLFCVLIPTPHIVYSSLV